MDATAVLSTLQADAGNDVDAEISAYQQRPTLLDPVLPKCMALLTSAYLDGAREQYLHTIYVFARVRGYKVVLQNFPTEISVLPVISNELSNLQTGDWQSQYVLLLWLAAAVLVPFNLANIHADLPARLYELGTRYLGSSGIQRDAAAVFMARLLTRSASEQGAAVNAFVEQNNLGEIGVLQVLAHAMDRLSVVPSRIDELLEQAELQIDRGEQLHYYESTLTTKYWLKVLGRSALRNVNRWGEFAISECISVFDNASSQVRMSAAKQLARILKTMHDEPALVEVVETIIGSLEATSVNAASPNYWNGALIALAETARSSIIAWPVQLIDPLVELLCNKAALHFVQLRTRSNIGSNVRDAACYVCWALFRSRATQLTADHRNQLYVSLTALACLDNEINLRRAAAAALQEGLGRYGSSAGDLPATQMFEIMECINMYTVNSISHCYLELAPRFCQDADTARWFVTHGINSANADTRRIAAQALPHLKFASGVIDLILQSDEKINSHGKMLALASSAPTSKAYLDSIEVNYDDLTDLEAEGLLRLAAMNPTSMIIRVLEAIPVTDSTEVTNAAADLMHLVTQIDEVTILIKQNMRHNRLFVACLVRLVATHSELMPLLHEACRLPDPLARAWCMRVLPTDSSRSVALLIAGLNDYSEDERGDVGAWVREAAVARVVETRFTNEEILASLWRMASENRQKLRQVSGSALHKLGLVEELPASAASYYYALLSQVPVQFRSVAAQGIASSVGAARASVATINGSLDGLLQFLQQTNSQWVLEEIVKISRNSTARTLEVVRTLKRLAISWYQFGQFRRSVLAIAYNTTLAVKSEVILQDAVDILQILAPTEPKARERLANMVQRHANGRIRQRCAEALFELGEENDEMETRDYSRM